MNRSMILKLFAFALNSCETYEEHTDPVIFMGGGKWTFVDYDIVIINSLSQITIVKNDTICINSFSSVEETPGGIILKQDYGHTSMTRRFIRNKTQWEFEGYDLYCSWINTPGGMTPAHDPFRVTYPNFLYTDHSVMSVTDTYTGAKTDFTFITNNKGVAPPNKLIMTSPDIAINLYSSNGARDKAVTFKVVLTFMR